MKYYMDEMKAMKPWDTQDENFKQDEHGNWYVEDKEVYDWWMRFDEALEYLNDTLSPEELEEKEAYMTGDMNEYIWLADELKESE